MLAVGPYSKRALIDYLCHWQTLLLNTLPVGLLVLLFYGVTGRTGAAFVGNIVLRGAPLVEVGKILGILIDFPIQEHRRQYAWYLREQGYAIQGSHPYYQWFYNRQNINGYLGFQQYRYLEGDYEKMTSAPYPEDAILLPEIYADMQKCWAEGKPCFSFSVNVQSHGPYATWDTGAKEYLAGDGYTAECRNAVSVSTVPPAKMLVTRSPV